MAGDFNLGKAHGTIEIEYNGAGAKKAEEDIQKVEKSSEKAGKAADNTEKATKKVSDGMVLVGSAAVAGLGLAVKSASNFESAMASVRAAGNASTEEMEKLRAAALKLGADTKFSATEVANGMEALIKAGLTTSDVLNGAADAAVSLAAAEKIELAEASEIAATAMTAFALKASDLPNIANTISRSASATKQTVTDFAQAMNQAGAVSKLVGLSFDDMALAITAMGKAGIVGSDAGTSLKTFLLNLQPVTKEQKNLFDDLGITVEGAGNKFFDASGKIRSMTEIAGVLQTALKGQTEQQKLLTLETLFGSDAIRAAAVISGQGAQGMQGLTKEMASQLSVTEKAKIQMDTFEGTMENFKGTLESAAISIGAVLIPVLKDIVKFLDMLANWFNALPGPIKETLTWIIAISGLLLLLGGAIIKIITIGGKFIAAIKVLTSAMSGLGAVLSSPWLILALAIAAIVALIIMNWDTIVKFLTDTWNWIKDTAASIWNGIKDFFAEWWWLLLGIVTGGLGVIIALIIKNWDDITAWLKQRWDDIRNFFVDLWNNIWNFLKGIFTNMINGTKNFLGDLVRFFMELPGNILDALGDLGRLLIDAGMDIIRGLIDGLERAAQWVWDKIRSIGEGIKDFFSDIMGIFSPSKVFRAYGEYTLEGYVVGLDNMEQSVYRKVAAIAGNIAVEGAVEPSRAVAASEALLPATAFSGGNESTSARPIEVGTLVLKVAGNLDPTDPVGFRQTIVRIKEAIRTVDRSYA